MYNQGKFDRDTDDVQNLATCLIHGIDILDEIIKVWPRYSKERFDKCKNYIDRKVNKNMPWWAKRFDKIWTKLTEAQIETLTLEWYFEGDEKPSQAENAEKLGISLASYQERLYFAYKKFEKLYPEFKRKKRSPVKAEVKISPAPLFVINSEGEKIKIPQPVKKLKNLSYRQKMEIKRWAKESTTDNLIFNNFLNDE